MPVAAAANGGTAGRPGVDAPCPSLDACLAALKSLPEIDVPDQALYEKQEAIRGALTAYGRAAIPGLLRLLAGPEREPRKQAAFTLGDIDGLSPADLPALLRAYDAGERRVARAIAAVGTPEAIAALCTVLKAEPSDYWLPYAFKRLGRVGVPALMGVFDCHDGTTPPGDSPGDACQLALLESVAHIFEQLGPDASDAIPRLTAIARDRKRASPVRRAAIKNLAAIGPTAASVAPTLEAIARAEPAEFAKTVETAYFGLKLPAAGKILAARLTGSPGDQLVLRDLAELGAGGQPATRRVIALLNDPDWEVRVAAARALGYFGDRHAVLPLVGVLDNVENWQLSWAAAESLGRLGDVRADAPLAVLERDHWYPPVRESARKARAAIADRKPHLSSWEPENFAFEFFEFENAGREVTPCRPRGEWRRDTFLPNDDLRRALADKMTYGAVIVGYGAASPGQSSRHESQTKQVPSAALQVIDGWLLGGNRGEWGGELVFVNHAGHQTTLIDGNIDAIARLGSGIVALGGIAHLGSNRGLAYVVTRNAKGRWSARPWRVLPGEPWSSLLEADGSWLVDTNSGTIDLLPDGKLRMVSCAE